MTTAEGPPKRLKLATRIEEPPVHLEEMQVSLEPVTAQPQEVVAPAQSVPELPEVTAPITTLRLDEKLITAGIYPTSLTGDERGRLRTSDDSRFLGGAAVDGRINGIREARAAAEARRKEVEEAPLPLEIKASPLVYDGEHATELVAAFNSNLALVSGGDVAAPDGTTVHTDGIFGEESERIEATLRAIGKARQTLAEFRGVHDERVRVPGLGIIRESKAIREAEVAKRSLVKARDVEVSKAQSQVTRRGKEIDDFCKNEGVKDALRKRFDHIIEIEQFIATNPEVTDLTPIKNHLSPLGLKDTITITSLNDRLEGFKMASVEYDEYQRLVVGYDQEVEGETQHVKGLRDFEADVEGVRQEYTQREQKAGAVVAKARRKAEQWERVAAKLEERYSPREKALNARLKMLDRIQAFVADNYVPDGETITATTAEIAELDADYSKLYESVGTATELCAKHLGIEPARAANKITIANEALRSIAKKRTDLSHEQNSLVNPERRLTQKGTPGELTAAVQMVTAEGFRLEDVPRDQRVLAETALVLLGKGRVTIGEKKPAELPAEEVVEEEVVEGEGPPKKEVVPQGQTPEALRQYSVDEVIKLASLPLNQGDNRAVFIQAAIGAYPDQVQALVDRGAFTADEIVAAIGEPLAEDAPEETRQTVTSDAGEFLQGLSGHLEQTYGEEFSPEDARQALETGLPHLENNLPEGVTREQALRQMADQVNTALKMPDLPPQQRKQLINILTCLGLVAFIPLVASGTSNEH